MKNVEKAEKVHLGSLIDQLKKGHYIIPDFQRDFEWEPWDVLSLVRSIFMDYYIGTLLLWKGSKENYEILSCEPIYGFEGSNDPQHIILDGQQRLTAIYYAFFNPGKPFPRRKNPIVYFLNINKLLNEEYEEAFFYDTSSKKYTNILQNKEEQYKHHLFPLSEMKEGTWGTGDWINGYRDYWTNQLENVDAENELKRDQYAVYVKNAREFKDIIEELFNQYFISYIELDRDIDIAKVCDIFTQINSKGVKLDIFDLLNAILRPKEIYLKQMWKQAEEELQFTKPKKMKIYILQVMSILEQYYCSAKYLYYMVPGATKTIKKPDRTKDEIVLIPDEETFKQKWSRSVDAIKKTITILKNPREYGAINPYFVPYPSIIPAFAAIKAFVEESDGKNKLDMQAKIRKWYWASIFTNRYSSSVESISAKDFQDLKKWFNNEDDKPEVIKEFFSTYKNIDLLNDNPKGSAIYNAIFNLFIINGARDWSTFELPEYESLDDHHIVPASVFKDENVPTINRILNRTPLSPTTNRHIINNRMPNEYLKEMFDNNDNEKVYDVLASHLISKKAVSILLRKPFTKSDLDDFLRERQNTIINAIENQLIKEKINVPISLKELDNEIESIENSLRSFIVNSFEDSHKAYQKNTPGHIQEKVEKRIESEKRKNPHLSDNDFNLFSKRIMYFDLFEYYDIMASKLNWPHFEPYFKNKNQLQTRFKQLSTLRNAIRHSREVSPIERHDGEAAIAWFKGILK
jgi:hypothetical protein